eukprot:3131827-Alexandrium_andersonii.AAC.1
MTADWKPSWKGWGTQQKSDWQDSGKYWNGGQRKRRPMRPGQREREALRGEAEGKNSSSQRGRSPERE